MSEEIKIIYLDNDIAAVHKPSGMFVHRTSLDNRETVFALQLLRNFLGERVYPLHRLDRAASGILLFARNKDAASVGAGHFSERRVNKEYRCLVRGFAPEEGVIDHPLREESSRGVKEPGEGREAVTSFTLLERYEFPVEGMRFPTSRYSLVEVKPLTGRRHQIRRHLRHIGHPLIGDTRHGEGVHNRLFRKHFGCHRLMLAATAITIPHPVSGLKLEIREEPDDDFMAVIEGVRTFQYPISNKE